MLDTVRPAPATVNTRVDSFMVGSMLAFARSDRGARTSDARRAITCRGPDCGDHQPSGAKAAQATRRHPTGWADRGEGRTAEARCDVRRDRRKVGVGLQMWPTQQGTYG